MAAKKIIVVPCIVIIWLKTSGGTARNSGQRSWKRITIASAPPITRKSTAIRKYMMPIFL